MKKGTAGCLLMPFKSFFEITYMLLKEITQQTWVDHPETRRRFLLQ
jgi:hypothetical protein